MKKVLIAGFIIVFGVIVVLGGFLFYVYFTNRTIDQTLATNLAVSSEWTEIVPDSPLTKTRRVQEIDFEIPDFKNDAKPLHPWGQVRLPNGVTEGPQIEVYDEFGNKYELQKTVYSISTKDSVGYTPIKDLPENVRLIKVRIRSDEPFLCERLLWRNRNRK